MCVPESMVLESAAFRAQISVRDSYALTHICAADSELPLRELRAHESRVAPVNRPLCSTRLPTIMLDGRLEVQRPRLSIVHCESKSCLPQSYAEVAQGAEQKIARLGRQPPAHRGALSCPSTGTKPCCAEPRTLSTSHGTCAACSPQAPTGLNMLSVL